MQDDALSVIISGSSAALAMPAYLTWMRQEIELPVRVLLTHSAERFIQPHAIAWHADEVFASGDLRLNPTEFARRSLAIVVLPCTGHMIACAALGLAGSPAQTALLGAERPVMFFPNMNKLMWTKPAMQRNVETLRQDGHTVVEPPERPIFELWRKENAIGPALPTPEEATELIIAWLESIVTAAA